jgi:syntaxin 1B/2/3
MQDRMADLKEKLKDKIKGKIGGKKKARKQESSGEENREDVSEDKSELSEKQVKKIELVKQTENPAFNEWLTRIRQCNEEIGCINEKSEDIKRYGEKLTKQTSAEREKVIIGKVEAICDDNNASIKLVDQVVKELQNTLKENKFGFDKEEIDKLCFQYRSLVDNYKESIIVFMKTQTIFKDTNKSKIKRQLTVLDPNLTEREKEKILSDPAQVQELINKRISGRAHIKLTSAVKDIQDKYNDIIQLEANINQLLELLTEINALIHDSGQMVDQINANFHAGNLLTKKGNKNLEEAKDEHKKAKGKQWWMCICAIGALCVIGAPILLTILVNTKVF